MLSERSEFICSSGMSLELQKLSRYTNEVNVQLTETA